MSGGKVVAEIRDSDGSPPGSLLLMGTSNIADGSFHHVAMLRDMSISQLRIYVDGVLDASAALTAGADGAIQNNDGEADPLLIGGFFNGGTTTLRDPFSGIIDELEYFNRALTQTEIQAIVNAGSAGKCRTCTPPPSGMINWWPGDGNANDIQSNNNGTPQNGATFAAGKVGQTFSFDGVNDYVSLPDSPSWNFGTGNFTIDFWERSSNSGSRMHALSFEPSYGTRNLDFDFNDGVGMFVYWNGTGANRILAGSQGSYTNGQWRHIALTRSGTTLTLYVDSSVVGSATYSGPIDLSNSTIN